MRRVVTFILALVLTAAPAAAASGNCLAEYAGGGGCIRAERLSRPVRHGSLYNTHRLLINGDEYLINAADADYLRHCCQAVIDDVVQHRLYDAERGQIWDLGYTPKEKKP